MSFILDEIMDLDPYSLKKEEKRKLFTKALTNLTQFHYDNCPEYRKVLDILKYIPGREMTPEDVPMIPVRLFKEQELRSVPEDQIIKTMTSSGTSGQRVSKIFLDKKNSADQTKVLSMIISSYIGKKRLPLIILDSKQVLKDRSMFSARGAGIVGFSTFGHNICYALDSEMNLDLDGIRAYVDKYSNEPILMFGYTYMIWQYVVQALKKANIVIPIKKGSLFHIGGWKKLKEQAVDAFTYNQQIRDVLGNIKVFNYYGMAEQLGSVFVECEYGHMHCSNFSDILIRNPFDFSIVGKRKKGLIELQSLLPTSYPGHVLLTEDEGEILGEDDCPCGRLGKYFKIHGRIKGAEIRGCSDTYERK